MSTPNDGLHNATPPTPGTSPTAVTVVQSPYGDLIERFKGALLRDGAKPSTVSDYHRWAQKFLAFCAVSKLNLGTLHPDVPEQFYLSIGYPPNTPQRNMPSAALRAFMRFTNGEGGVFIPELNFPKGMAPKRKPKPVAPPVAEAPTQDFVTVDTRISHTPEYSMPPENTIPSLEVSAAPPAPAPVYVPPPAPAAPASAPANVSTFNQQRVVDVRQTKARNPLGALFPQGGKIVVSRVSDGSDGQSPGSVHPVGEYTEPSFRGFRDLPSFVKERVHPNLQSGATPLTITTAIEYQVSHIDDFGRTTGQGMRVVVPNPQGTGGVVGRGIPAATGNLDMVDRLLSEMRAELTREMHRREQAEAKLQETIERTSKDGGNAFLPLLLARGQQSQDSTPQIIAAFEARIKEAMKQNAPPPMLAPMLPPGPDPTMKAALDMNARLVDRLTQPAAAPPDAMTMLRTAKEFMQPGAHETAALTELRDQNRRLNDKIDMMQQKPSPTMDGMVEQWMRMDDMLQRRFGNAGGGEMWATALNAFAEKLPEAIDALARLRGGVKLPDPAQVAAARAARDGHAPAAQGQQAPPPTPEMVASFGGFASAQTDWDTLNATYALINALATARPDILRDLDAAIKTIETVDEMQALIGQVFAACGQNGLVKSHPGIVRRVSDALAANFDVVCDTLGIPVRKIAGAREPQAPPANAAPATPKQDDGVVTGTVVEEDEEEEEVEVGKVGNANVG